MILSKKEMLEFINKVLYPNEETIKRKNDFFEKCSMLKIESVNGCDYIISQDIDEEAILRQLDT